VNLQAVSLAKAAVPSTDSSASTPGHSDAAKPTAHPFNHVLGSLISREGKPSEPTSSKKQLSTQDPPAGQLPVSGSPPAQPAMPPTMLKFNLLLPASPKTEASGTDEGGGGEGDSEGLGSNQTTQGGSYFLQLAALQGVPQQPLLLVPAADSNPQTPLPEAQAASRGVTSGGDPLRSTKIQGSLLQPLNLSTADQEKPRFTVNSASDEDQPLPKAELALSVKITPTAAVVPENANTPSVNPAPRVGITAPMPSPESASVSAMGANQQADTSADTDSEPTSKQILKPQAKPQSEPALPNTDPAPVIGNQYAAPVMTPVALVTASTPSAAPPVTKHESEPTTQPQDARPDVAALPEAGAMSRSEPVRDLSIRIGNNPGNQVDVKIQERAGEVHVSVLSSSPSLTSDLRQQVGDLVGKLDRAGYHAETFKPTSSTPSQQTSNQSEQGQDRDSSGGRQQQQQQETAQQQFLGRQKRSNQTQWLQQMNGSFGLSATEGIERQ
jgi:hypothetical protein